MDQVAVKTDIGRHGESSLPAVEVDCYGSELRDDDGFIGDRASRPAFHAILQEWRKTFRKLGADPFADTEDQVSGKLLDDALANGDMAAAAVVQSTIEEFAQQFAKVIQRFLKTKAWADTERIVVGGGLRRHKVGELAIARTAGILAQGGAKTELRVIANEPHDAGLLGCLHLVPAWIFEGRDAILAVDIGGTNIRAGVVEPRVAKAADFSKSTVRESKLWRHADDGPNRKEAIQGLVDMLQELIKLAEKDGLNLAPFVGIGCPGLINEDGSISKGAQNLPGNWHGGKFNLPNALREALPKIGGHDVAILLHNDAVVQGLSEVPRMRDVKRWGVLTIGTGLGNVRFSNRVVEK
jgi:predicted NBD/HSP70 family sugar kinase